MRILLVHNFYGSSAPSGENRVVLDERDLLRTAGHEVIEHFEQSDSVRDRGLLPILGAAPLVPWNAGARRKLKRLLAEVDPDVMHVHNVFPLFSPAILGAAAGMRTAVVNTLHNYRTLCAGAAPVRNGTTCTSCIDRGTVWPSLQHRCYRNSLLATIPVAASVALHRGLATYTRQVDAFIALTEFQKAVLVRGGFPEQRMYVKPNCFPQVPEPAPWSEREDKAVFLGRLSPEKGVATLVTAWEKWGRAAPRLEIIGTGPELERLRASLSPAGADRIVFLGQKSSEDTRLLLSKAKLLILPSEWFEGFPLVLCEALAFGVPVAASRLGAFEELIGAPGAGALFTPKNPEDLRATVSGLWQDQTTLREMGRLAHREFEAKYSGCQSVQALEAIYRRALETKRTRLRPTLRERCPSVGST